MQHDKSVASRRVGTDGVVVNPPAFRQDLHLLQRVENLSVQQLVPQLRVERFAVAVLPPTAGLDVERLGAGIGQPLPCPSLTHAMRLPRMAHRTTPSFRA